MLASHGTHVQKMLQSRRFDAEIAHNGGRLSSQRSIWHTLTLRNAARRGDVSADVRSLPILQEDLAL
jgi:hypothetical protein